MEKPAMSPAPGERLLRFVGDTVSFSLRRTDDVLIPGCRAMLRTNLGKAAATREEIISSRVAAALPRLVRSMARQPGIRTSSVRRSEKETVSPTKRNRRSPGAGDMAGFSIEKF